MKFIWVNEDLLQYIWGMQLLDTQLLQTTAGESIQIIHPGQHNTNAGPDFLHAKIKIGDTIWAGSVEIHVHASDWKNHAHSINPAFKNVILHVVFENDGYETGIPLLELNGRIPRTFLKKYQTMMQTATWIPCEKHIQAFEQIKWKAWLQRLIAERLEQKALHIEERLHYNKNDWEETLYQLLARSFGLPVNAIPFEKTAQQIGLKILHRHRNNPVQIEALLFGQAGFLEGRFKELYPHQLQSEYRYLRNKYNLPDVLQAYEWKFSRMRPPAFPTIRMSQLAALLVKEDKLFDALVMQDDVKKLVSVFEVNPSDYWKEHFHFKKAAKVKVAGLGKSTIHILLINTIAPFKYLYGLRTGNQKLIEAAIGLLEKIPAEKNNIVEGWRRLERTAENASESQAMIHLKKEYCNARRCLQCHVGYFVLRNE